MSASPEVLWKMTGVAKAFDERVLFRDAELEVARGEKLAIIGESGCGKSVWLKMMIGLVEPDAGEILYKGRPLRERTQEEMQTMREEVGYLFQAGALFDSMTVFDNIVYALREHTDQSDAQMRERAAKCVSMVNLEPRVLDLWPANLSGGMKKRVALARAIATQPHIVLYDEPTQGLDPQTITHIAYMIDNLADQLSITTVLVTHDMRCAFGVCDRIAMVAEERFAFIGTPKWFLETDEPEVRAFIDEARADLEAVGILEQLGIAGAGPGHARTGDTVVATSLQPARTGDTVVPASAEPASAEPATDQSPASEPAPAETSDSSSRT